MLCHGTLSDVLRGLTLDGMLPSRCAGMPRTIPLHGHLEVCLSSAPALAPTPPKKPAAPRKRKPYTGALLRVRMKHSTLRRLNEIAEYERIRQRDAEARRGKHMSTLVLEWILAQLDVYETRMLEEMEAADLAKTAGFAGKTPAETAPWAGLGEPALARAEDPIPVAAPVRGRVHARARADAG